MTSFPVTRGGLGQLGRMAVSGSQPCSDCGVIVGASDQLDLSMIRWRQPLCRGCFARAKRTGKVPAPRTFKWAVVGKFSRLPSQHWVQFNTRNGSVYLKCMGYTDQSPTLSDEPWPTDIYPVCRHGCCTAAYEALTPPDAAEMARVRLALLDLERRLL